MSTDTIAAHAVRRPAGRLRVGWWVRSYEDDGTERWSEITTIMDGTVVTTGQRVRRIYCSNGVYIACGRDDIATCCNKAEAKRAGLVSS